MSYLQLAALAESPEWLRRVRACLTEQLADTPEQLNAEQLAYAAAWPLAASPGFGSSSEPPSDGQLLAAAQAWLADQGL